jgi:hypothetical protein
MFCTSHFLWFNYHTIILRRLKITKLFIIKCSEPFSYLTFLYWLTNLFLTVLCLNSFSLYSSPRNEGSNFTHIQKDVWNCRFVYSKVNYLWVHLKPLHLKTVGFKLSLNVIKTYTVQCSKELKFIRYCGFDIFEIWFGFNGVKRRPEIVDKLLIYSWSSNIHHFPQAIKFTTRNISSYIHTYIHTS